MHYCPCPTVRDADAVFPAFIFSRGHATLHLAVSVGPSVRPSVRPSVTFLNCDRFSHYCSCPTVRDWITVYPALFHFPIALPHSSDPAWHSASLHAPSLGVCLSPGQCSRLVSRFDYCQNVPLQRFPLNCHSSKSHKDDVCSICAK